MDELERLAIEAEADEQSEAEALQSEPQVKSASEPEPDINKTEAAENRAESILRIVEGGVKLLVDSRLQLTEQNIKDGRETLGAVIEKYDFQGTGTGRLPMEEEARAGFFVGSLAKTFIRAKKALNKLDKKQEQQKDGKEREHATVKPAQSLSSKIGVRKDSDVAPPFRNS